MDVIGGKWKIPIMCSLRLDGSSRYNELLRNITGITNTMLASSLKELQRDGLVKRVQYQEMPLRVEYSITESCEALLPALQIIAKWSKDTLLNEE